MNFIQQDVEVRDCPIHVSLDEEGECTGGCFNWDGKMQFQDRKLQAFMDMFRMIYKVGMEGGIYDTTNTGEQRR